MDLRQLRNLVFVARYSSYGVAASKLNVTQPALSKSIRALEQTVGARLLDRGQWGVKPTVYGVRLIEYAEAVLRLTEEAQDELATMRGAQRGKLRVGGIATTIRTILPIAARRFLDEFPGVKLSLNEELTAPLQGQLLAGSIDVALMPLPGDFPVDELEYRDLVEVPVNIVAAVDHPLVRREALALSDLTGWNWLIPARPDPDRLALDGLFAAAQLPLPVAACETTSSAIQLTLLKGSRWLSYLSRSSEFAIGPDAPFVPLKLENAAWTRSIKVVYRRQRVANPLVQSFIRTLEDACTPSPPVHSPRTDPFV